MKKALLILLKVSLTCGLLAYLLHRNQIDLGKAWLHLRHANLGWIAGALFLTILGQIFCVQRWSLLLKTLSIHIPLRRLTSFYFIGMFFSLFFPSLVGGDLVKMFYLRRDSGKPLETVLTAIYLDRALGLLSLLLMGMAGAIWMPLFLTPQHFRPIQWVGLASVPLWLINGAMTAGFIIINLILFSDFICRLVCGILTKIRLSKLAERVSSMHASVTIFKKRPDTLLAPFAYSVVNIAFVVLMNWMLARAVGIDLNIISLAPMICIITVILMLPLTINGIGLRENAFIGLLLLVFVPPDAGLSISLLNMLIVMLSALPGGVCYSLLKRELPIPPAATMTNA